MAGSNMLRYTCVIMASNFNSTMFMLQKWSNEDNRKFDTVRTIELDIVNDNTSREVCRGADCSLFYDNENNDYLTMGNCKKENLCTKINFIKDSIFISKGIQSSTCESLNFSKHLKNWK